MCVHISPCVGLNTYYEAKAALKSQTEYAGRKSRETHETATMLAEIMDQTLETDFCFPL
jgi:hypothetical protein